MRYRLVLLPLLLFLAACSATKAQEKVASAAPPIASTRTATATRPVYKIKVVPKATSTALVIPTLVPTVPSSQREEKELLNPFHTIPSFADFPGNLARGEAAPDFTLNLLDGTQFILSEQIGEYYLLVLPTTLGCGECLYSLGEVTAVFPTFRNRNIKVVVADIIPENEPEWWSTYAKLFAEPDFLWGVVASEQFLLDYEIEGLGTFLLIDPPGRLVFERRSPLNADEIAQLFNLTQR